MLYSLGDLQPSLPEDDSAFVARNATVIGNVELKANSSVWYNVVIRGDSDRIVVGENTNVQDGSILHTDPGLELQLGSGVTVGHMVMLHGCHIGDNSLVGIQAVVMNGCRIGENCLIGAGTLLPEGKAIPDGSLVLGSPGKVVRQLSSDEIEVLKLSAQHYVENGRRHRADLKALSS